MDWASTISTGLGIATGGFTSLLTAGVPLVFRWLQDKSDKVQQLEILKLQVENAKILGTTRTIEVITQAEIEQAKADSANYQTAMGSQVAFAKESKIVATFSGLVRPMITFAMFGMWGGMKVYGAYHHISFDDLWSTEDVAIWAYLITFWFGHQAIRQHDKD